MKLQTPPRTAFSFAEVAAMFGKNRSWIYRMARSGRIKTIKGFGNELVAASEIARILGEDQNQEGSAQ